LRNLFKASIALCESSTGYPHRLRAADMAIRISTSSSTTSTGSFTTILPLMSVSLVNITPRPNCQVGPQFLPAGKSNPTNRKGLSGKTINSLLLFIVFLTFLRILRNCIFTFYVRRGPGDDLTVTNQVEQRGILIYPRLNNPCTANGSFCINDRLTS